MDHWWLGTDRRSWEPEKFVVRQPQKEQAGATKIRFLWIVRWTLWFLLLKCICWRSVIWPLYVIVDIDLYLRSVFVFSIDLDLCLRSVYAFYVGIFVRYGSKLSRCLKTTIFIYLFFGYATWRLSSMVLNLLSLCQVWWAWIVCMFASDLRSGIFLDCV